MVSQVVVNNTLQKADLFKKTGKLEQAWVLYEKLYRHLPKDIRVVSALADLEDSRGKVKRARSLLKSIVTPESDYAVTGLLAMHYYRTGSYFSALRLCLLSLKKEPENAEIYADIAGILCFLEMTNRALPYLAQGVQLNQDDYSLVIQYANALYTSKQYQKALELYEKALRLCEAGDLRSLQEKQALCLFKTGEDALAANIVLSFYTPDLGNTDSDAKKLYFVGDSYLAKGNVELAEFVMRYANSDSSSLFILLGLAECLMQREQWLAAEDVLAKVPQKDRESGGYLYVSTKLYASIDKCDVALKLISQCLIERPESKSAQYLKAYSLDGLYRYSESEPLLLEVIEQEPEAKKCLATMYFSQGIMDKGFYYFQYRVEEKSWFRNLVQTIPYFTAWDGEKNLNKLMLIDEQGIGDKIRYAFFYQALSQQVEEIYVVTDGRLKTLLERSFDKLTVVPMTGFPPTKYAIDHAVPHLFSVPDLGLVFNLPLIAGNGDLKEIGFTRGQGYLKPQPESVQYWSDIFNRKKGVVNIGVCWRGPVAKTGREDWYTSLSDLLTIFTGMEDRVNIVSLQFNMDQAERNTLSHVSPDNLISTNIDMRDDFDGMAGLIGALDLVITPATALFELSGALGIPSWVFATKARKKWNLESEYMKCFYPTVETLYSDEPWQDVFGLMRERIAERIRSLS